MPDDDRVPPPQQRYSFARNTLMEICATVFSPLERYDLLVSPIPEVRAAALKLDPLGPCGQPIISLLHRQCEIIRHLIEGRERVIRRCSDLMQIAHDKFYAYPFKDVPVCWIELYRQASLMKFAAIARSSVWRVLRKHAEKDTPSYTDSELDDMVYTLDMALIMTGPSPDPATRENVNTALDLLQICHVNSLTKSRAPENDCPAPKRRKLNTSEITSCAFLPIPSIFDVTAMDPRIPRSCKVSKEPRISIRAFTQHMHSPTNPDIGPESLIITGEIKNWPALEAWRDPEYLMDKTIGGRRLVPVETGTSYVDAGFGQKIIRFKEFMDKYILHPESPTDKGYLAQHDLFSQIPSLRNDVMIPDYCYMDAPGPHPSSPFASAHAHLPRLEEPLLNAWFGPAGTTTPLHTDPYHNILAQVVGRKYVRLYAPRESMNLYARGIEDGIDMSNTSMLDVGILAGLDGTQSDRVAAAAQFPFAKNAVYMECILEEGECLYIPIGWWHYVRSLSVSFSVSFWFN